MKLHVHRGVARAAQHFCCKAEVRPGAGRYLNHPFDLQAGLRPAAAARAARPAGRQLEAAAASNNADSSKAGDKCSPSLLDVAKEQGQLRQLVALAAAGYDLFAADGGKPFTALAPSDRALKQLAAGAPGIAAGGAAQSYNHRCRWHGLAAASSALQACCASKQPLLAPRGGGARAPARAARLRPEPSHLPPHLYCRTAAGIENEDERLLLEDGLYSVILYQQLPQG